MKQHQRSKSFRPEPRRAVYDVLYGFVPIAEWEEQLINSPFYQRLRWIKQLGFANYIFPGAEHTRFAHAIGVMHSMHQMVQALGVGVPESELFDRKVKSPEAQLHRAVRIAALLHDVGTFPFSHAIEYAYIRHGNDDRRVGSRGAKSLPNSHEHLGSFIIKNSHYDGGISRILDDFDLDARLISKIIKGDSKQLIANQLMHSDLDADRMDYLIRDAHFTGIKYGQFDRDYILANLVPYAAGKGQIGFGVQESAIHAVEDFLIARFSWYSQVIRNQGSAKFDVMSTHVAEAFLDQDLLHQFHDLLQMVEDRDERFFWWNDVYFLTRCQEVRSQKLHQDPRVQELVQMLLYRIPPKTLKHPLFEHRYLNTAGTTDERAERIGKMLQLIEEMKRVLEKHGTGEEWILVDIPQKDVSFTGSKKTDALKLVDRDGKAHNLVDHRHSLLRHLTPFQNFIPAVYANEKAYRLLAKKKLVE